MSLLVDENLADTGNVNNSREQGESGDSYYRGNRREPDPVLNPTQFGPGVTPQGVLGVDLYATSDEVNSAYKAKGLKLGAPTSENQTAWQELNWAKEVLSDKKLRDQYAEFTANQIRHSTEGQRATRRATPTRKQPSHQYGPFGGEVPKYASYRSIFDFAPVFARKAEMDNEQLEMRALQERLNALSPGGREIVWNIALVVMYVEKTFPDYGISMNKETLDRIIFYVERLKDTTLASTGFMLQRDPAILR